MPCRSAGHLSFLLLKASPDRLYGFPRLPQGLDRPIPGILQGTYRQVVLLKASSDDPVVSFRRQCGLTAQRFCHDVDHCGNGCTIRGPHGYRLLGVVAGIALVTVQRLLTERRDAPQQAVDDTPIFRHDGSKPAASERQFVVFQYSRSHDLCRRAAPRHLFQINVAAVGKI